MNNMLFKLYHAFSELEQRCLNEEYTTHVDDEIFGLYFNNEEYMILEHYPKKSLDTVIHRYYIYGNYVHGFSMTNNVVEFKWKGDCLK